MINTYLPYANTGLCLLIIVLVLTSMQRLHTVINIRLTGVTAELRELRLRLHVVEKEQETAPDATDHQQLKVRMGEVERQQVDQ